MEGGGSGGDHVQGGGGNGNGNGGSRWNPTKEQINMLEGLYKQGLRTPTAEQIQQITVRLRDFGHIEGKNVFYWFQNHKARQRQKQKQDTYAYFNRFLHHPSPLFTLPYQNVGCSPCYMATPKNEGQLYHHYPKVLPIPAGNYSKRPILIPESTSQSQRYNKPMHDPRTKNQEEHNHHQETLDLFPIHPTGILQSRTGIETDSNPCPSSSSDQNDGLNNDTNIQYPFFDFFCGKGN
ncbi:hypothetical protein ABFS83_06G188600 [Erythranthe nasuta]